MFDVPHFIVESLKGGPKTNLENARNYSSVQSGMRTNLVLKAGGANWQEPRLGVLNMLMN